MRDVCSRWWRPVGAWALTVNASLGFPVLMAMAIFDKGSPHIGTLVGSYGTVLATWATIAGIRQWGKNNGSESTDV